MRSGYLIPASSRARRGRNCYATPTLLRVAHAKRRDEIRSGYATHIFSGAQKRAELLRNPCNLGVANAKPRSKIRSGYLTLAFSGAQKRAEFLRNRCILREPQQRGRKSEVAAPPLASRRPIRGQNCYVNPAFSGIPNAKRGDEIKSGYLIPAFSGAHKRAELLCNACILGDPQQRGRKSEVATPPLPSRGPKKGRKRYVTLAFSGVPNERKENQKWLPHPCLLGGPEEGGIPT